MFILCRTWNTCDQDQEQQGYYIDPVNPHYLKLDGTKYNSQDTGGCNILKTNYINLLGLSTRFDISMVFKM